MSSSEHAHELRESRWWYWIAAMALLVVVGGVIFLIALLIIAVSEEVGLLLLLVFIPIALLGLGLAIMFPIALYKDATLVTEANLEWKPDPLLYGLVGLVTAVPTIGIVSMVVALYYLYRRHEYVGIP